MSVGSPRIVLAKPIIPFDDLGAYGVPGRQYVLGDDILPVLALLSGLSELGPRAVSLTPAGAVRTADVGAGYTHVDPHEGTLAAGASVTVTFTQVVSSVIVNVDTNECTVAHSLDGVNFDPVQSILAGEKVSMDVVTRALTVHNISAGAAGYRVWGLYFAGAAA